MSTFINNSAKTIRTKFLFILLGAGVILYALYILFVSHTLTYDAQPANKQIIFFVLQRIFVGILFFIAVINITKLPFKESWIAWIIFTGLFARLILIPSSPILEDDYYRYLWDGAVTANEYNPYVFSPKEVIEKNPEVSEEILKLSEQSGDVIHKIKYPEIKTIYPAMAQIVFAFSYYLYPWSLTGWKLILLVGDIFLLFFIFRILRELKLPYSFAAIYWLNPIVLHEFFNAAHYDLFALLFTAISIYYYLKDEYTTSIVTLAFAVGFKLWPILLLPILLRKFFNQKIKLITNLAVFALFLLIIFIPVLRAGIDENQGLIKYAANWFNNAAFFTLLKDSITLFTDTFKIYYVCADCIARWIAAGIIILTTFVLIRKPANNNYDLMNKIVIVVAIAFLISPTQFPWYITWMILPLVFSPKYSLLMYAFLIPLYHLNPVGNYFKYIQHIPVILLFLYEIKKKNSFRIFNYSQLNNEKRPV